MPNAVSFFSYSRVDSGFAIKLAKDLRKAGISLWIDQLDIKPGSHWDASIETGLNAANSMIVILTPDAVASNNVMDEVSYALESGKRIIPILLKDCKTPFRLRRLQRIDFTGDYNTGFDLLLEALKDSLAVAINEAEEISSFNQAEPAEETNPDLLKKAEPLVQPLISLPVPQVSAPLDHQIKKEKLVPGYQPAHNADLHLQNQLTKQRPFHHHRLVSFIIAGIILAAIFLPWWIYEGIGSKVTTIGITSKWGLLSIVGILAVATVSIIGDRTKPFGHAIKILIMASFILIILSGILNIVMVSSQKTTVWYQGYNVAVSNSIGIGCWLTLFLSLTGLAYSLSQLIKSGNRIVNPVRK